MEALYSNLHIRPRFQAIRKLVRERKAGSEEPAYGWWHSLLGIMSAPEELQSKLMSVLKELSHELHSSYSQVQYLSRSGTFERVLYTDMPTANTSEELPGRIFEQAMLRRETICVDTRTGEFSKNPWVILNEVRSVLAVPFFRRDQFLGLWYFERRSTAPFIIVDVLATKEWIMERSKRIPFGKPASLLFTRRKFLLLWDIP